MDREIVISDNKYKFISDSSSSMRNDGFRHTSRLFCNGIQIAIERVVYYNRTLEEYTFQTCMKKAVKSAIDASTDNIPNLKTLYDTL